MHRRISQECYDPERAALYESLFMVGNGRFGLRGAEDERSHAAFRGTLVNGFFEKKPISYGEWAYGYAKNYETILNAFDAASVELSIDGSPLELSREPGSGYARSLDLDTGMLERTVEWTSPSGVPVSTRSKRFASFPRPAVAALRYEVAAKGACRARLESFLDGSVRNRPNEEGDPRVGAHLDADPLAWSRVEASREGLILAGTTKRSGLGLAVCVLHDFGSGSVSLETEGIAQGESLVVRFSARLAPLSLLRLDKFVAVASGKAADLAALVDEVTKAAAKARNSGFESLAFEQRDYLSRFWSGADIRIDGDPSMEVGLRFNIFHLLQSVGRDGKTNIAAKGLSGEGYEGHYFWDTEIYALPFFTYEAPEIARSLVGYRIGILDKARERAAELGLPGALFPWRTIDGEETSAYFPAGTAQFHIDADVAYALCRYVRSSGDERVLSEGGAELLFETARTWIALGFFNPRKGGRFCIPCVTGPDEYTALVDNNAYTNLMAENNLRRAAEAAESLAASRPEEYRVLAARLGLDMAEIALWRRAADFMYVPYDKETGIVPQDDQFMDRPAWDIGATPKEAFPLLLHHHPLMIYRRRVLKQPDTVLAMFLRHERFGLAEKMRNFRFYEALTTGDSSLSHCIQSIAAAECGLVDSAYAYFAKTARMDLDDIHGNSRDGVHIAAMAGSWLSVVYGFAGMREEADCLSFRPSLPTSWSRLSFSIAYRGSRFSCSYSPESSVYILKTGPAVSFEHEGKQYRLDPGETLEIDERPRPLAWIFDLDGVIANTAVLHFRAWKRLADELGLGFDEERNELLKGVSRMDSLRIVLGDRATDYDTVSLEDFAKRKNGYYRELIAEVGPSDILPGMGKFLADLKAEGKKLALASASRNAPAILERLGLGNVFDAIVAPDSLSMPKPDPEIFLTAAKKLGARTRDCVALEDAQAGIDAIKAGGLFAVGIGGRLEGADILFDDTRSVDRAGIEAAFARRSAPRKAKASSSI
jgi:alpha,alpha-trehalose phosphorylase